MKISIPDTLGCPLTHTELNGVQGGGASGQSKKQGLIKIEGIQGESQETKYTPNVILF